MCMEELVQKSFQCVPPGLNGGLGQQIKELPVKLVDRFAAN